MDAVHFNNMQYLPFLSLCRCFRVDECYLRHAFTIENITNVIL